MCYVMLFYRSLVIGIIISADYKISLYGLDEVCKLLCSLHNLAVFSYLDSCLFTVIN